MKPNENLHCYVPCSMQQRNSGQCGCLSRGLSRGTIPTGPGDFSILGRTKLPDPKKSTSIICPNCGNNKLVDIAAELDGGYKCIDCGIRFKKGG